MTVSLLLISDGRKEYLKRCLASFDHLPEFDDYIWVDDSEHKLGFAGAIREGWSQVKTDYVFHLEQDFIFDRTIPLDQMVKLLERDNQLAQVALLRQPWNEQERAAGGIAALLDDQLASCWDGENHWLEHRHVFTTNPSIYPRWVVERGWPAGLNSEGTFSASLFEDPEIRCAFWGEGEEWCEHIGHERAGWGYW